MNPKATQENREIAIYTPLGEDVLLLHKFTYDEKLGGLFDIEVEMFSDRNGIPFEDLLGQKVTIRVNLPHEKIRYINGYVSSFSQGEPQRGFATYYASISPWNWLMGRTTDCKIFQEMTVPDILKEIFGKHPIADFEFRLSAEYREWEYCVQYRESDLNFVNRLMEQEGIYYYFEHDEETHKMVLVDDTSVHEVIEDYEAIPYYPPDSTVVRDHEHIDSWKVHKEIQSGAIALDDYNFKIPKADLSSIKEVDHGHAASLMEHYDFPGEFKDSGESEFYSTVRMQEQHTRYATIFGASNTRGLTAGGLFSMIKHHRKDQNREYLVTDVSHHVQQDLYSSSLEQITPFIHTNQFSVITSETPFRNLSITPKPSVQGIQTAVVVGPPGEEIYTDEFGRVKCQFHWDRYGKMDQDSSCWIRVSQMWAGPQWGHIALPRIGQEVIIDFIEGDPDRPMITGRTYNADNMPPYPLDSMKTRMSIKSQTYKGDGFNELRFEDLAGEEEVFIHAQKDQTNIVLDNETTTVGSNRSETVGENEKIDIGGSRNESVGGSESITIQGARTETINQAQTLTVKKDIVIQSAKGSITLKTAGGHIVIMENGDIVINGKTIDIDGSDKITLN